MMVHLICLTSYHKTLKNVSYDFNRVMPRSSADQGAVFGSIFLISRVTMLNMIYLYDTLIDVVDRGRETQI